MKIGKVSESVLKRSVLRQLKTKRSEILCGAGIGGDCAIFSLTEGEKVVSCMQEASVMLSEHNTETGCSDVKITIKHLVQKCANNLAVSGAEPMAAMITLMLPETIEEQDIKQLMKEAEEACHALSMQIAGGQTRVSEAVKAPIAVVTGYDKVQDDKLYTAKAAKPGQDIVISKWITRRKHK